MPDTIDDVLFDAGDWFDVETLTGITTGTALIIQNKGLDTVLLQINSVKPDATDSNGPLMHEGPIGSTITVDSGENTVWLKSGGPKRARLNIQIGTATGGGGGVTVQSDWDQTDSMADDFIRNKPVALSEFTNDLTLVDSVVAGTGITVDNTDPQNPIVATAATNGVVTQDEGTQLDATAQTLNFTGDLVTATNAGSNVTTVNVDSSGLSGTFASPITVQNSGSSVTTDVEQLNFVGGGVTATAAGDNVTITVPTIPTLTSQLTNDSFVETVTVGAGLLTVDNSDAQNPILNTTAINGIRIEDDGVSVVGTATAINFTGNATTVTDAGSGEATVTIDTSIFTDSFSAPITVQEEGANVATAIDQINFVGAGVTASATGNDVTITVPEIPTTTSDLTNDSVVASVVGSPKVSIDNTDPRNPIISTSAIESIRVEDDGVSTVASATALNFAGAGVVVTDAGSGEATVTIAGAAAGTDVAIEEEGTELTSAVESINFVGSATATAVGNDVTVTIPTIPTDVSELTNTSLLTDVDAGTGISIDKTNAIEPVISINTAVDTRAQSATHSLDLSSFFSFEITASGNTTLSFTNSPSGSVTVKVALVVSNTPTITLPTARYPGGTAPTFTNGRHLVVFTTNDGGTSWDAIHVGGEAFS